MQTENAWALELHIAEGSERAVSQPHLSLYVFAISDCFLQEVFFVLSSVGGLFDFDAVFGVRWQQVPG